MLKLIVSLFVSLALLTCKSNQQQRRSLTVDKDRNIFLKDGQPFRYISGEINYFRIHHADWEDRIKKVRAAGLNAVSVYVPWMLYEPTPNTFDFSGQQNFTHFLFLAQRHELFVMLRIGPYVCAELDFGGLPWWLNRQEHIELRTSDPKFMQPVKRYFDQLLPLVKPLLYTNGGPVIAIQIENEYGARVWNLHGCEGIDRQYIEWLRNEVKAQLGDDIFLYATDNLDPGRLPCALTEGIYHTIDFSPQPNQSRIAFFFDYQRKFMGGGPPVNSEFYSVWFSWWSNPMEVIQEPAIYRKNLEWLWAIGASFSFYMFHGGTNFGFLAGNKNEQIQGNKEGPVLQSYDYAAPISESGQITPLYEAIRGWIKEIPDWPNKPLDIPSNQSGARFENIRATRLDILPLIYEIIAKEHSSSNGSCLITEKPINIEHLNKDYPLTLYSTVLNGTGAVLEIPGMADHGYVFLDGIFQGNLTNKYSGEFPRKLSLDKLEAGVGQKLDIIVEHVGRLIFPLSELDPKGILSEVLLNGRPIGSEWRLCGIDILHLQKAAHEKLNHVDVRITADLDKPKSGPAVYVAQFASDNSSIHHTFFDSRGWEHGISVVNDFVVGRYWPVAGPQKTLFVPGAVLSGNATNSVTLIELSGRQKEDRRINFVADPIWEYTSTKTLNNPTAPGGNIVVDGQ